GGMNWGCEVGCGSGGDVGTGKKKNFFFFMCPADGAARLVPDGDRNRLAVRSEDRLRLSERMARLKVIVAHELEETSVQLVGARFRLRTDHHGPGVPDLRVKRARCNLRFRY